jgi:hypothetical protein
MMFVSNSSFESRLDLAVAVTPSLEFLDDPGGETRRRIVEPARQTVGSRALNQRVCALLLDPFIVSGEEGLLIA